MFETVAFTKDGQRIMLYGKDFLEITEKLKPFEIVEFAGKEISLKDVRQGRESRID